MESLAIIGWHEGAAGLIHSWIGQTGYRVECFIHPAAEPPAVDPAAATAGRASRLFEAPTATGFRGLPLYSASDWPSLLHSKGLSRALVALTDEQERLREIDRAEAAGIELINAVHPTALIMPEAVVGKNVILHARAFVGYRAEIADGVILNTGSQVDHHDVIREGATLDIGVLLAGNVTVDRCARICSGVIAIPRVTIGEQAVVGAGAVLIRNVPPRSLAVGNPARIVRTW